MFHAKNDISEKNMDLLALYMIYFGALWHLLIHLPYTLRGKINEKKSCLA